MSLSLRLLVFITLTVFALGPSGCSGKSETNARGRSGGVNGTPEKDAGTAPGSTGGNPSSEVGNGTAAGGTATGGAGTSATGTGTDGGTAAGAGTAGGTDDDDFKQAGMPTAINGAYLTAYRDAPADGAVDNANVTVYVVIRDAAGKAVAKPFPTDRSVASFDDGAEIEGVVDDDPKVEHHLRFQVPKARLASISLGKDRILGAMRVNSPRFAESQLETSIVIWLANVKLVAERSDFGTITFPPGSQPVERLHIDVLVAAKEQPAQNALIKGLAGDFNVAGGTCPALSATAPVALTEDCSIELEPRRVLTFDRVVTLSYYNGIRQAFTSFVLRGRTMVSLSIQVPGKVIPCGDGIAVSEYVSGSTLIAFWKSVPQRSNEAPGAVIGPSNDIMDMACDGNRLFVLANAGKEIRVFDPIPSQANATPKFTLSGITDVVKIDARGGALYMTKYAQLLSWDPVPEAAPFPAPKVMVQATLDAGGRPATNFEYKFDLSTDGKMFFESNYQTCRVSVWNKTPTGAADFFLGQPDATTYGANSTGVSASSMYAPGRAVSNGDVLAIPDESNHRVLLWRPLPKTTGAPATTVIGQPDFISNIENGLGDSPDSLKRPFAVALLGENLAISDRGHSRVIIRPLPKEAINALPANGDTYVEGESAGAILTFESLYQELGNLDFAHLEKDQLGIVYSGNTEARVTAATFSGTGFAFAGGSYPGTGGTCGAVIKASCFLGIIPTGDKQGVRQGTLKLNYDNGVEEREAVIALSATARYLADRVIGQRDFTSIRTADQFDLKTIRGAHVVRISDQSLLVSDGHHGRILVYDNIDAVESTAIEAKTYLGPGYTTAQGISHYYNAFPLAGHLYASNDDGSLVGWNTIPKTGNPPPDFTIGANILGNCKYPRYMATSGQQFLAATKLALCVWNAAPDSNNDAPNVLVEAPFGTDSWIGGLAVADGKVLVSDYRKVQPRLLVWNQVPSNSSAQPASIVTGLLANYDTLVNQMNQNNGGFFADMAWDGTHLFMAENNGHRVLIFQGIPTTGDLPVIVLGQLSTSSFHRNDGGVGAWSLSNPTSVALKGEHLFIGDTGNARVLRWPLPALP